MGKIHISQKSGEAAKGVLRSLITWSWTKRLLNWIILSAGTGAELAFLIASVWMSINANAHAFVLNFLAQSQTDNLSSLATIMYVALPECIVFLAVQTTLSHFFLVMHHRKDADKELFFAELAWTILYGMPAILFVVLSVLTLSLSVLSKNVTLPDWAVVLRALGGYEYAFVAFLYVGNGAPKLKREMAKRDNLIADLRQENENNLQKLAQEKDAIIADLQKDVSYLKDHTANQKMLLDQLKKSEQELLNEVNKSSELALEAYGEECINWLHSGVKSVSLEDITRFTGHSKRKIDNALTAGKLRYPPRNKDRNLVLIDSLIDWLKETPPSDRNSKTGEHPALRLHVVNE